MSGAELFTGNCLIAISLLERQCTPAGMLRNWAIVYLSNFAGALLVAAGCAFFGQLNYSGGLLAVFTMKLAAGKCALPFQNTFVLAILCNLLVCLGVILAMTAKDTAGRFIGAFLPVCYFVICGFEHCVANMYYIPAGLMAKAVPAYAQLAAEMGVGLSRPHRGQFPVAQSAARYSGQPGGRGGHRRPAVVLQPGKNNFRSLKPGDNKRTQET